MTDGAQTAKSAAHKQIAAGSETLKQAADKSLAAFSDLNAQSKQNLEAVVASVSIATKGAETLGAQLMAFGKKSLEDNIGAAKALSGARSFQEATELQTAWAKSTMESYMAEFSRASETVAATFKDSFTPISARVTAAVETFKPVL